MDVRGQQFLARTRFSGQQHAGVGARRQRGLFQDSFEAGLDRSSARAPAISRRRWFSSRSLDFSSACLRDSSTLSRLSGFSRKSKAPARVASTASAMVPWPEIISAGAATSLAAASAPGRCRCRPAAGRRSGIRRAVCEKRLGFGDPPQALTA